METPTASTLRDAGISEKSLHFCPDIRTYIPEDRVSTHTVHLFAFYTRPPELTETLVSCLRPDLLSGHRTLR